MRLPSDQNELISQVAAANPNTVVVLAGGAPVEMPWLAQVKAVLQMYLPGQAGGQAAAELLTGAVNPSGKLAESFPFSYLDVPSAGLFEKGGKQAQYREGIYVGYRYYDKANQAVCFPFGYGLSYTTFTYSHLQLSRKEMQAADELLATVRVKNSGDRDGAEIVQLYVSDLEPAISRPAKELKGFEKVFLKAGEEIEVIFPLNVRSFAWYDAAGGAWVVPEGRYQISIGASSRDIRLQEEVILHGSRPKIDDARQCRWYTSLEGKPTEDDFQALMGHPIVPPKKVRKGEFDLSSSVLDMKGSLFIRAMLRWIERTVAAEFGGADYRNPNFRMVMEFTTTSPVKNLVIASSGRFPITVAQGLIELANGHYLKGMKYFLSKKA